MKLAKKMLVCMLALALTLACGMSAFAADASNVVLSAKYDKGVVTLELGLKDAAAGGVESITAFIDYDASVLTFVGAESKLDAGLLAEAGLVAEGQVSCAATGSGAAKDGLVAVYTFNVKEGATADSVKFELAEGSNLNEEDDITLSTSVSVKEPETTTKKAPETTTKKAPAATTKAPAATTKAPAATTKAAATSSITKTGEAGIAVIAGVSALAAVAFVVTKKK